MSSDPKEAELLQPKKQLSAYCGHLKNLFLSRSHYKNQSCHTSPEYEVNKDSTNTLVTKDDDDRFHFLQTADGRHEFSTFGKNEASHCEVPETSLCIISATNALQIFSFSRKYCHRRCVLLAQRYRETTTNPHLVIGSVNVCFWHPV